METLTSLITNKNIVRNKKKIFLKLCQNMKIESKETRYKIFSFNFILLGPPVALLQGNTVQLGWQSFSAFVQYRFQFSL